MKEEQKFDEIGMFKGKFISEMTREELLDFARWAAKRIEELQKMADRYQEAELDHEMKLIINSSSK